MKNIGALLAFCILVASAMAAYYFSDSQVKKRALRATFAQLSETVATHDRAKISANLGSLLTDDASIHLTVRFFAIGSQQPAMEQDFDKTQFIKFIDDTLYSLADYGTAPRLEKLDANTGDFSLTSAEWGEGTDSMGGVSLNMRYGATTKCNGHVVFENKHPRFRDLTCQLQFHQTPKPGQEGKFLDKQGLMGLLGR